MRSPVDRARTWDLSWRSIWAPPIRSRRTRQASGAASEQRRRGWRAGTARVVRQRRVQLASVSRAWPTKKAAKLAISMVRNTTAANTANLPRASATGAAPPSTTSGSSRCCTPVINSPECADSQLRDERAGQRSEDRGFTGSSPPGWLAVMAVIRARIRPSSRRRSAGCRRWIAAIGTWSIPISGPGLGDPQIRSGGRFRWVSVSAWRHDRGIGDLGVVRRNRWSVS